ncbi:MAG: transposase, partial [Gammaproteobacteria bacterium]
RYRLKTPYRDGTTHVLFEPLDLLARLAALVPPPRVHLARFHGLFAPHHRLRARITPSGRSRRTSTRPTKHSAMRWMQRLKRAFRIDIETCARCGGRLRVIASIEEPALIRHILDHLEPRDGSGAPPPPARAPPPAWLSR